MTQVMDLSDDEGARFWPIYREYQQELAKLEDKKQALIKDYTDNYVNLTDAKAHELAAAEFELESQQLALKKKYFERVEKTLSSKTAARFAQVEHQLMMLLDLQLMSILPVVSK